MARAVVGKRVWLMAQDREKRVREMGWDGEVVREVARAVAETGYHLAMAVF